MKIKKPKKIYPQFSITPNTLVKNRWGVFPSGKDENEVIVFDQKDIITGLDLIRYSNMPTIVDNWQYNINNYSWINALDFNVHDVFDTDQITTFVHPYTEILSENEINYYRLRKYEKEFTATLIRLILESDFEFGYYSAVDKFIDQRLIENTSITKEWLNSIFVKNINNITITLGLLRAIAHIDYNLIMPEGQTMAMAALAHKNPEVRECGIRVFENWNNFESLDILRNCKCEEDWLSEYLKQVIKDIEASNKNVNSSKKN